ncbi:MAG: hypothetical protein HQM13_09640 [SAR324 cluster bacterium]|nr:hypothetical protein [SAR324 cluster bacterium]
MTNFRKFQRFLLLLGMCCIYGNILTAQSLSLSLSETLLQSYLSAEFHGQDVSTEKDQSFGFDNVRIQIEDSRAIITTDFWYKKFLSKAKVSPLIDVTGDIKVSFNAVYLPKKKRVVLTKSSIEHLNLVKGNSLRPLLEPLLKTAIDRIVVWKKVDRLKIGNQFEFPINNVQVDFLHQSVIVHLNQPSPIPAAMLEQMFVIVVNESTLNAVLGTISSGLSARAIGIVKSNVGTQYEMVISGTPSLDIFPGPDLQSGETRFALPIALNPVSGDSEKKGSLPLTLILQVVPHLEGSEQEVSINLELKNEFDVKTEAFSLQEETWIRPELEAYITQIGALLSQFKVAVPAIPFISNSRRLQLLKILLEQDQMALGASIVE